MSKWQWMRKIVFITFYLLASATKNSPFFAFFHNFLLLLLLILFRTTSVLFEIKLLFFGLNYSRTCFCVCTAWGCMYCLNVPDIRFLLLLIFLSHSKGEEWKKLRLWRVVGNFMALFWWLEASKKKIKF